MEVKASLKQAPIGILKARVVADLVRGKQVEQAVKELMFCSKKKAAQMIQKLIESGIANAEQDESVDIDNLYVKRITVDQGKYLKRFKPTARGRSMALKKKTSHIQVILDEF